MGKQAKRDSFNILMWWNDYHLLLLTTLIVAHFLEFSCILGDNEVGQVGKVMGNIWEFEECVEPGFCISHNAISLFFFFNLPRPFCLNSIKTTSRMTMMTDNNANNAISHIIICECVSEVSTLFKIISGESLPRNTVFEPLFWGLCLKRRRPLTAKHGSFVTTVFLEVTTQCSHLICHSV